MLARVLIGALLVLGVMVAAKDDSFLRRAGILGSCRTAAGANATGDWQVCRRGVIGGLPNLGAKGCAAQWTRGSLEAWYCPAPVAAGPEGL